MATKKDKTFYTDIMFDMETLGLTADSVILSIGAVKFTNDKIADDAFYATCNIDSQRDRHISGGTLAWWVGQGDKAKEVFAAPTHDLSDALVEFAKWIDHAEYRLWSNGADFDIPLLNHALRTHDMGPVVKHWNHRCFRTLKELFKNVPKPAFEGTQHNALMDAIHQAKWTQAILQAR